MSNLLNTVARALNDDVIIQLSKQLGAQNPNQVKKAAMGAAELLVDAVARQANNQESGGGLMGALKKDHDGGILGDLVNILSGRKQMNNNKTMDGSGILSHLLGNKQIEAAQMIAQYSGLDFFKSGVLMQFIAPIVMGSVGQEQRSGGLDLGGLAKVLMGGAQQSSQSGSGGILSKVLDMDGDGSMMDDLLNVGMKILTKK